MLVCSRRYLCSLCLLRLISLQFCLLLPARGVGSGEGPSIKSPSRKTAPIDNRDDKAPNDFSRCLRSHRNRDHYLLLPASPRPALPASPSGATSSVTNSGLWIWMTSSSVESKSRTQRPRLKRPFSVYNDDNNNRDVIVAKSANGRQDLWRLGKSVSPRHHYHLLHHPSFHSVEIVCVVFFVLARFFSSGLTHEMIIIIIPCPPPHASPVHQSPMLRPRSHWVLVLLFPGE